MLLKVQQRTWPTFSIINNPICACVHTWSCLALSDPMDCNPPGYKQKYWGGLPFPSPGDLPNPEIKPASLTSPALAVGLFATSATRAHREEKCQCSSVI